MGFRDELVCARIIVSPEPKPLHLATGKSAKLVLPKVLGGKAIWLARIFRVPS